MIKKIILLLMPLALMGAHANELIFKDVSAITVIKNGEKLHRVGMKNNKQLSGVLSQVILIDETSLYKKTGKTSWDYKLIIDKKKSADSWLYSSRTGLIKLLTKQKTPLYQFKDLDGFNKILKINK